MSYMREGDQEMYSKVPADSQVPQLEKALEEAQMKWANLDKERVAWPPIYGYQGLAIEGIK